MKKLKSFQVETVLGGGTLEVFEESGGAFFAQFHGSSGLAHLKNDGRATPLMRPVDFRFDDFSYDKLIEKCRFEIEKCDSAITKFVSIND